MSAPAGVGSLAPASYRPRPLSTILKKIQKAIAAKDFSDTIDGIPVLTYTSVREAEMPVGLGPLHTQFDGKGNAYTSLFVESAVAKWKLPPYEDGADMNQYILEKIPVAYNIGHLVAAEGDSKSPDGNYLVATQQTFQRKTPECWPFHPRICPIDRCQRRQYEIVILDAFTEPEPHYAQMIKADKLNPVEVYKKDDPYWPKHQEAVLDC